MRGKNRLPRRTGLISRKESGAPSSLNDCIHGVKHRCHQPGQGVLHPRGNRLDAGPADQVPEALEHALHKTPEALACLRNHWA